MPVWMAWKESAKKFWWEQKSAAAWENAIYLGPPQIEVALVVLNRFGNLEDPKPYIFGKIIANESLEKG